MKIWNPFISWAQRPSAKDPCLTVLSGPAQRTWKVHGGGVGWWDDTHNKNKTQNIKRIYNISCLSNRLFFSHYTSGYPPLYCLGSGFLRIYFLHIVTCVTWRPMFTILGSAKIYHSNTYAKSLSLGPHNTYCYLFEVQSHVEFILHFQL